MKKYTKIYMDYFGYTAADWMPCEIPGCNRKAVDVMHIYPKSTNDHLRDNIVNLMGGCREHHTEYGDNAAVRPSLYNIHIAFMNNHGKEKKKVVSNLSKLKRPKLYKVWKKRSG